jgi:hypothetical protein
MVGTSNGIVLCQVLCFLLYWAFWRSRYIYFYDTYMGPGSRERGLHSSSEQQSLEASILSTDIFVVFSIQNLWPWPCLRSYSAIHYKFALLVIPLDPAILNLNVAGTQGLPLNGQNGGKKRRDAGSLRVATVATSVARTDCTAPACMASNAKGPHE